MRRLDHHADAARLQHVVDGVRDLRGEFFLDWKPLAKASTTRASLLMPDHAAVGR